jgi:hypothetical protein
VTRLSTDVRALLRRTCAASGVPERLEDPAVVEEVAAILRTAPMTTGAAPKDGAADTTANAERTRDDDSSAA